MPKSPETFPKTFVKCDDCGHEYETDAENDFSFCPECETKNLTPGVESYDDAGPCCLGEAYGSHHTPGCFAIIP